MAKVYFVSAPTTVNPRWAVCVREEHQTVGFVLSEHNTEQKAKDVLRQREQAAISKLIVNKRQSRKPDNKIAFEMLKSAFTK
jgi:type II secretory pathway component PulJ